MLNPFDSASKPTPILSGTFNNNTVVTGARWSFTPTFTNKQECYQDLEKKEEPHPNWRNETTWIDEVTFYYNKDKEKVLSGDTSVLHKTGNLKIKKVSSALEGLLQYKNSKYGNTALEPLSIFSKVSGETGLLQRIDDKIARIKNSNELRKNDISDLMGYLTLLCVTKGWDNFDEFKD